MKLDEFDRYPLLFGPSPVHPLDRLSAHLGGAAIWAKREDCNSGPRIRREQDPQARVPARRRPRAGLRHPRLDRRRPVQPHPPGRRRRRACWPEVRPRPGELGRLAGRDVRPRRQHPLEPAHGRRRPAREGRSSASASRRVGSGRSPTIVERRAASRTRFRPAPPTTASAA